VEQSIAPCPRHKAADHTRLVSVVYAQDAADFLRPVPVVKAADRLAWAGTGCGVAGMIAIWAGNAIGGTAIGIALGCAGVCFAYALALYGLAAARRTRLSRVERGMPRAMALWRAAWYCDLCNGVFCPPGDLMTVAEFQRMVWAAGGYGELSPASTRAT
jgi:hypothetical protein